MKARSTTTLVIGLGGAQLLAWGTLYYAIAVIGEPMGRDLGITESELFGAFAWSMLLSGVFAPWAGRQLDRVGGRLVLAASTLVGALGFALLASAHSFTMLLVGWSLNGLAMALGLYETCFAALGQAAPQAYRSTVTGVTLIAGFASTVAWPASHYLLQSVGWRATCAVFAAVLLLCLPVYLVVLPTRPRTLAPAPAGALPTPLRSRARGRASTQASLELRRQARWLALAFAGAALIGASMSAHLVSTLKALQLSSERAVWVASAIGVLQVLGRLLDLVFGATRQSALQLGFVTFAGLAASMLLLFGAVALPWLVFAFVVVYGVANGLSTIAKAVLPVELFGLANVGSILGSFSAPSLIARAAAPLAYAAVVSEVGILAALGSLVVVGVASLGAYAITTRSTVRLQRRACEIPS